MRPINRVRRSDPVLEDRYGTKAARHVPRLPVPAWPYIFPPGTPKDRIQIIREAMRKAFADPEFPKEFHKLTGDDLAPLGGEELEKAIKELSRDKEVVQLYQKLAGADPLAAR